MKDDSPFAVRAGKKLHAADCALIRNGPPWVDYLSRSQAEEWLAKNNERDRCLICSPEIVRPPRNRNPAKMWPTRCRDKLGTVRCGRLLGHGGVHARQMKTGVVMWGGDEVPTFEWAEPVDTPNGE